KLQEQFNQLRSTKIKPPDWLTLAQYTADLKHLGLWEMAELNNNEKEQIKNTLTNLRAKLPHYSSIGETVDLTRLLYNAYTLNIELEPLNSDEHDILSTLPQKIRQNSAHHEQLVYIQQISRLLNCPIHELQSAGDNKFIHNAITKKLNHDEISAPQAVGLVGELARYETEATKELLTEPIIQSALNKTMATLNRTKESADYLTYAHLLPALKYISELK
ncbi:MAG: hypothetical protein AAB657_00825, partial [Patescibacteria group bacterium]